MGGVPIARLLGIEIRVSFTWAILVAIVTLLGAEQAAITAPGLATPVRWLIGIAIALGFLVSVVIHELAHALVGRRYGVEAKVIVLGFVGGLAPLSIQASTPRRELSIALAGPLVSLALGGGLLAVGVLDALVAPGLGALAGSLVVLGALNVLLAALSLLPGMPLDGGRVVRALAWARTADKDRAGAVTARVGRLLGFTVIGVGIAMALADLATEGLLVVALGWLLTTGARTLDRRLALERLLRGATVREAMQPAAAWVGPNLTVDTFADRYEGPEGVPAMPVVDDDRVLGIIGRRRLQRLGRRRFGSTRAMDVMAVPPQTPVLAPDDPLWDALDVMNTGGLEGLAVAVEGRLTGMLTRDSVSEAVRLRAAAQAARGGMA
ncbi:MAG TPA: site-2 protease family protein [Candidatus Limnocylindrales bacterium]|nr:site-2 protease family protein [Candidatus Limnocylindrales bacterium]